MVLSYDNYCTLKACNQFSVPIKEVVLDIPIFFYLFFKVQTNGKYVNF